ncbi:hypothetical protein Hs30E_18020 [Lactococcus hodotermopsidis]|uniref:Uncharacterized protein n=1 Tax=Pseudolactococcus hodotermopsidis TaxID=2709157 RepID=A0A6A0BG57_9LACT|nr:hypothetical protein [Lactococcus hodotermopsidis]GFH43251.1 hypothetical protein Hs30E_18020 [Lactococcus hodotermopsidis]
MKEDILQFEIFDTALEILNNLNEASDALKANISKNKLSGVEKDLYGDNVNSYKISKTGLLAKNRWEINFNIADYGTHRTVQAVALGTPLSSMAMSAFANDRETLAKNISLKTSKKNRDKILVYVGLV